MKYISYLLTRILIFIFGLLPFGIVYKISDFVSWLLFNVVKYRRKLVESNVAKVFPTYTDLERKHIVNKSYANLGDIIIEGLKGASMNKPQLIERYKFINPGILDESFEKGRSAILVTGHYNNWEWGALSTTYFFKHLVVGLYKKLNNPYVESFFKKSRAATGIALVELSETAKGFAKYTNQERPSFYLLAADQSPSNTEKAHWIEFLGQDTACLHGPGKYATEYNLPLLYCDIQRVKRGFYELELSWLIKEPKEYSEAEIVEKFMRRLEKEIIKDPGNWLWSHNRWKHSR